ncbi:PepSY-associated TM helix domain-containing protein [Aliikangiella sp. IMCC44359]|uniref:PepSY-associated TM helix domain-containing protein n=1 Tax=Aliikangiella sp. IMCC44359 TaxID=3459125 RepID=UPI00403A9A76
MNQQTKRQLTSAHSWLGLIISGALMIVFLCGTLSFFKSNIHAWEQYHHQEKKLPDDILSPADITKIIMDRNYNIPADHRVLLLFPTDESPQYQAFFSTEESNGTHKRYRLYFDPETGKELNNTSGRYYLADFLYKLHIDLNIPGGTQIVGIISLIFFVVVFSGILIHLKKLIKYFYQYRLKKSIHTYLDGHNLIGVTSLPYTFMYALTGVMFNLSILFQAGFGYLVFQGDIGELSKTSGFKSPTNIETSGEPMNWQAIDLTIDHANQQLPGAKVYLAKIFAFGDENAQVELRLVDTNSVTERLTLTYPLDDYLNFKQTHVMENPVQGAYHVLKQLHYGNFGGIALQFVYFFLGLGCCYLILSGNLIWLKKHAANRKENKQRSLAFVRAMTLCFSIGCMLSVAICFVATRFLPETFARVDTLPYLFSTGLIFSFFHTLLFRDSRQVMVQQALLSAILFAICPLYDLLQILLGGVTEGSLLNLILVSLVLSLTSVFCLLFAYQNRQIQISTTSQQLAY